MLRALLDDLTIIPDLEVVSTYDCRIAPMHSRTCFHKVTDQADVWPLWRSLCRASDAVWPIAPESNGCLEKLSLLALQEGARLLASHPVALRIAGSKWKSFQHFRRAGIPTIETCRFPDSPLSNHGWVVKPDDGAGCEDTWYLGDRGDFDCWVPRYDAHFVVQPFVPGPALSLSVLCNPDTMEVLSVNRQTVHVAGNRLRFEGVAVGEGSFDRESLAALAQGVARAIPGLWGFVGIDIILGESGPLVVDVNPRLTGAYVGLHAYRGENPAARVLGLLSAGVLQPQSAGRKTTAHDERPHA